MMVPLSSPITITGWRGLKATWVSLVRFFCITERGGEGWGEAGDEQGRRGGETGGRGSCLGMRLLKLSKK